MNLLGALSGSRERRRAALALLCGCTLLACSTSEGNSPRERTSDVTDADEPPPRAARADAGREGAAPSDGGSVGSVLRDGGAKRKPDPGAEPRYGEARPSFCDRPGSDDMRDLFCGDEPARIGSLREFQDLLGVSPAPGASIDADAPPIAIDRNTVLNSVVVISHSTALSGQLVSPINPRVLVLGSNSIVTYQRGVQQVELVTLDREEGGFNFFLLNFRQACNERPEGCSPGDLYTPRVERDWQSVAVRDDEDLKNTPLDCRQCHQRGLERPVLLMRELESPWTHFFELHQDDEPDAALPGVRGRDLVRDYLRAKGNEGYANVPAQFMRHTIPLTLQNLMAPQPLLFDAPLIEEERWPYGPNNELPTEPQRSPFWDRGYEAFKRGEQMAMPYFEVRATDPDKQAKLTEAYIRHRQGELSAEELPDLGDIFPDDAQQRAWIGLQNEPGATPAEALVQTCGSCHNDVLDQSISRSLFNIDLSRMDKLELELAIERLERPRGAPGVMPPPEFRQLDDDARAQLIDYLRSNRRSKQDDARLRHAAEVGMTGGEQR